jgi:hypothetical protein
MPLKALKKTTHCQGKRNAWPQLSPSAQADHLRAGLRVREEHAKNRPERVNTVAGIHRRDAHNLCGKQTLMPASGSAQLTMAKAYAGLHLS